MVCAVVNISTGVVENVIMADPVADNAPDGFALVFMKDGETASIGWHWSIEDGFMLPPDDPVVQDGLTF